jgi:hypothetical protein
MNKLRPVDVAAYRQRLLKKQRYICPLCKDKIRPEEAALDHDHKSGHIRAVLHRNCNGIEGRVINWTRRVGRTDPESYLRNLLKYWKRDYSHHPLHPNHGRKKRRRRRVRRR